MHHNAYPRPGQAPPEASLVFALEATEPKVTNGWRARLQGSPREGPESAPKPSFHCERETGFTEAEDPASHQGRLRPNGAALTAPASRPCAGRRTTVCS